MCEHHFHFSRIDNEVRGILEGILGSLAASPSGLAFDIADRMVVRQYTGAAAYMLHNIELGTRNVFEGESILLDAVPDTDGQLRAISLSLCGTDHAYGIGDIIQREEDKVFTTYEIGTGSPAGVHSRYVDRCDGIDSRFLRVLDRELSSLEVTDGVAWLSRYQPLPTDHRVRLSLADARDWLIRWTGQCWNALTYELDLMRRKHSQAELAPALEIHYGLWLGHEWHRRVVKIEMTAGVLSDSPPSEWLCAFCYVIRDGEDQYCVIATDERRIPEMADSMRMEIAGDGVLLENLLDAYAKGDSTVTTIQGNTMALPDTTLEVEPFGDDDDKDNA
jgi:hypothetical protein